MEPTVAITAAATSAALIRRKSTPRSVLDMFLSLFSSSVKSKIIPRPKSGHRSTAAHLVFITTIPKFGNITPCVRQNTNILSNRLREQRIKAGSVTCPLGWLLGFAFGFPRLPDCPTVLPAHALVFSVQLSFGKKKKNSPDSGPARTNSTIIADAEGSCSMPRRGGSGPGGYHAPKSEPSETSCYSSC